MTWILDAVKDTMRAARHRPGFALAVLVSLSIGIASTTAVLSLVDAVLVRPLPFASPERITGVWFKSPNLPGGLSRIRQSVATFSLFRDQSQVFDAFALAERTDVTVDNRTSATRIAAGLVTPEIFPVLAIAPALGRPFLARDNAPGADPTVMLSDQFWATRYNREPSAVGQTLTVDGVERLIIGVLPAAVRFPESGTQLWVPLVVDPARLVPSDFIYTGYGRLKDGISPAAADADFMRLVNLLPEVYPAAFSRALLARFQLSALFVPLQEELVGDSRQSLTIALLAVLVVMLIVVANVANLFLVRNETRHRDLAVQAAVGAGPARLVRGLIAEGVVYALAGGAIGLALGAGALTLLKRGGEGLIPRLNEVGLDARVVGTVMLLSLAVGVIVGLIPALRLRHLDLGGALRSGGKTIGARRGTARLRWALVAGQIALALALLVNAGLLVRSASELSHVDPGFDPDQVLGARLYLSARDYPTFADARRFYLELVDGTHRLPGVERAAAASFLPLRDGRIFVPYQVEGQDAEGTLPTPLLTKIVTDQYFETMGIKLLSGRTFTRADLEVTTDVVIVSQAFADATWPGQSALGKRIRAGGAPGDTTNVWLTVAGVVASVRDRDLTKPGAPIIYLPFQERHAGAEKRWREVSLAIRGAGAAGLASPLRALVAERDHSLPVYNTQTMAQVIRDTTARSRYTMLLLVATATSALFLAAVGLYGVLADIVNERRREMGLRMALGARPADVRAIVMRQALKLAGVGAGAGLLLTLGTNRVLASLLFGVQSVDPATFASVAITLGAVTWAAASVPAARAAAVHPAITLRED